MTMISNNRTLSNTTFHKRCSGKQGYWWLRSADGQFVDLGGLHRGDKDISVEIDLTPGKYTLGCGPQGQHGIRETVVVEEPKQDSGEMEIVRKNNPAVAEAIDQTDMGDGEAVATTARLVAAYCDSLRGRSMRTYSPARKRLIDAMTAVYGSLVSRRVDLLGE